jgi:hypothetical protein
MFQQALVAAAMIATATLSVGTSAAQAEFPGAHPAYRHALADLRVARGLIDVNSYARGADANEDIALDAIDRAIRDIKIAGVDDGKPMGFGVAPDPGIDRRGRLHRALQALRDAHRDATREEQNPAALGLRRRATIDIDVAIRHDKRAIADVAHAF